MLAAIGAAEKDHAIVWAGADAQQELEDVAAHLRVVVEELGVGVGRRVVVLFVVGLQVVGEDGEDARARVGEAEARAGEVLLEQVDQGLCLFFWRRYLVKDICLGETKLSDVKIYHVASFFF